MRRKRNRKWIRLVVVLILIAAASVIGYKVWEAYFKTEEAVIDGGGKEEKPKETQMEATEASKQETEVFVEEDPKVSPQYDGEDPNKGESLTGVITYAGVSDDVLMIRVNIDQYLASGSCVLTLVQDGAELYDETVGVIDSAATATCEGFNVPVSRVGASGKIGIRILVKSGEKAGIIEGEVKL